MREQTKDFVKDIKIAIVGGGHVGKVFSTLLVSLGYDVELVCRVKHRAIKIDNSYAFEIKGDFGDKSYLIPFVNNMDELSSKKDLIIFATKSFDMLDRVSSCLNKLTPTGTIVTIQNIFSIDKLYKLIPPESSVCMVCDFASTTHNKVTYVKNFNGITLGCYNKKAVNRMKLVAKVFKPLMKVSITKDVVGFVMGRNLINGAISLIGGITGLTLGEILKNKVGRRLFCKVIWESYNVCKRYKINVLPYNNKLDYERFCSHCHNGKVYCKKIIKLLYEQNGNIRSSAYEELQEGSKTEISSLLDSIVTYAKKSSTPIPVLSTLKKVMSEIEKGKKNIDESLLSEEKITDLVKNM